MAHNYSNTSVNQIVSVGKRKGLATDTIACHGSMHDRNFATGPNKFTLTFTPVPFSNYAIG